VIKSILTREGVDQVVTILRILLLFVACAFFAYLQKEALTNYLTAKTAAHRLAREARLPHPGKLMLKIDSSRSDYSLIDKKQIFGSAPVVENTPPPEVPKRELDLTLVGTVILDGFPPSAILEDKKTREQDSFMVGDSVFNQGELVEVTAEDIALKVDEGIKRLALEGGSASSGGGESLSNPGIQDIIVEESEVDQALANLPLLVTQARAVEFYQEGKSIGLRLFAIKSGSLFEKIGLRNGDILHSINGENLSDLGKALGLFEKLKKERNIRVEVTRNRQFQVFNYQIR
jgi:type II secretion system protein C